MLAPDLALANITLLPFWFSNDLTLGIKHESITRTRFIINSSRLPGRVIMPEGVSEHTQDQLRLAGVQPSLFPSKMIAGGGGLHCSTARSCRTSLIMASWFSAPQNGLDWLKHNHAALSPIMTIWIP